MRKALAVVVLGIFIVGNVAAASAQQPSWGAALKAAGQAAAQQLCPQAQATVDHAKALGAGAPQENFLITKAKEFLASGNYQPALDLANYVITTINSKSVDAPKIIADAKAALMKMAQDKLTQGQQATAPAVQQGQAQAAAVQKVQADAVQTGNSLKNLFGTTK